MTSVPDRPPPSTVSYVIATAILAISIGYFVGQGSSLGLFSSSRSKSKSTSGKSWPNSYDVTIHPDSSDEELITHLRGPGGRGVKDSEDEDEDEDEDEEEEEDEEEDEEEEEEEQGALKAFEGNKEECKLVLVVRTDLGMGKGKSLAPGCLEERVSKNKANK